MQQVVVIDDAGDSVAVEDWKVAYLCQVEHVVGQTQGVVKLQGQ